MLTCKGHLKVKVLHKEKKETKQIFCNNVLMKSIRGSGDVVRKRTKQTNNQET